MVEHKIVERSKTVEEMRDYFIGRLKEAKTAEDIRKILSEEWPFSGGYETR